MRAPVVALCLVLAAGCRALPASASTAAGTIAAPDGLELAYDLRGAERGRAPVVLLHGWCCDRGFWDPAASALASERVVVTLDFAGHGDSGTARDDWSLPRLADDLVHVVRELDLEGAILVGHSMGAPVALLATSRLGDRVRAVVAVDSLHDPDQVQDRAQLEPMVELLEADPQVFWQHMVRSSFPPDTDPEVVDHVLATAQATSPRVARELMLSFADHDPAATLAAVDVPVRCLNANTYPTRVERARELHPDFDAVVLQDVGHFPMLEAPELLLAVLVDVLDQLEER